MLSFDMKNHAAKTIHYSVKFWHYKVKKLKAVERYVYFPRIT